MSETKPYRDPYQGLPKPVLDELDRLVQSASRINLGMILSIFFPAGFLFVLGFGVLRVVQASRLVKQFPVLDKPVSRFPGKKASDFQVIAMSNENLKKVLQFSDARKAFWVAAVFPVVLYGSIITWVTMID